MFLNLKRPKKIANNNTTKDEFYRAKNAPWFEHVVANNLTAENNFDQCGEVDHQSHMGISNGLQSMSCNETKKEILDILILVEAKKTSFYSNRKDNPSDYHKDNPSDYHKDNPSDYRKDNPSDYRKDNFKSGITYYEFFERHIGYGMYETDSKKYSIDYFSKENYIQGCKDKKCFRIYFKN